MIEEIEICGIFSHFIYVIYSYVTLIEPNVTHNASAGADQVAKSA